MHDQGCHGGDHYVAYGWMHDSQVTDETCAIYRARGHDNGAPCTSQLKCDNCVPGLSQCGPQDNYKVYQVEEYGMVVGEHAMLQEIYQRGPVACGIAAIDSFDHQQPGYKGVYADFKNPTVYDDINHIISVVGYGVQDGTKYWMVRNSWGSAWGDNGFIRVERGINMIQIETDCAFAVPKDTWTDDVRHHNSPEETRDVNPVSIHNPAKEPESFLPMDFKRIGRVAGDLKDEDLIFQETPAWVKLAGVPMPANLDWRNMDGTNYASWNKN